MRRKKKDYFIIDKNDPKPLSVRIKRKVAFSEVDPLRIAWHGRYPIYFEEGYAALSRLAGFSFDDFFKAKVAAPIVQLHIDYFRPLFLDEEFFVEASLFWHEGARINIEYHLIRADGTLAASGYTVQMFVDEKGSPFMVTPGFIEEARRKWRNGEIL